jgi:hypothetical protein
MTTDETPQVACDWDSIRARYELREESVADIAASIGVSRFALINKARALGWMLRRTLEQKTLLAVKGEKPKDTIQRLKDLLETRITSLEQQLAQIGKDANHLKTERDIRAVGTLVRTLDKVFELERNNTERRKRAATGFRRFTDAERHALADKLEKLHREWTAEEAQQDSDEGGSRGAE